MKNKRILLIATALLPLASHAQDSSASASGGLAPELLLIIYVITALMLLLTFLLWRVSVHLRKFMRGEFETQEHKMYDNRSLWEKIFQLKPVGTDKETVMDHEYDGIRELDNPPPPWFMFLFYGTILIAVVYFIRFSVTGDGPTQAEEYAAEMAAAEMKVAEVVEDRGADIDESSVTYLKTEDAIAAGKKIYITNCKICHADAGAGQVGPNLADEYWIHGGGIQNVFKTIKYGVPEKGMISWEGTLTPMQMQQVSSYILSLEGTEPVGAKEPEGSLWEPEPEAAPETEEQQADSSE